MYGPPDSWILREPPEEDFDCECNGHNEICPGCNVRGSCWCDHAYDSWKEDRMLAYE